jgi:hypothetical protein
VKPSPGFGDKPRNPGVRRERIKKRGRGTMLIIRVLDID